MAHSFYKHFNLSQLTMVMVLMFLSTFSPKPLSEMNLLKIGYSYVDTIKLMIHC